MPINIGELLWPARVGLGFVAGTVIAGVDNFAAGGELSPIVIVAMLLAATSVAGIFWGWRGAAASVAAWAWVPLVHVVKHALGLPDSLHPNTWTSILYLAVFTLGIAIAGTALGMLFGRKMAPSRR